MPKKPQTADSKLTVKNCDNCKTGIKVVAFHKAGNQEFLSLGLQVCTRCSRNPMVGLLNSIATLTGVTLSDLWETPE